MTANESNSRGSQGGGGERRESLSRLNILIATTAAIVGLIYGYDLGSIASALLFLVPAFELSTFMTSVVTSAVVLGQLLGALFAGRISNTIGRKRTMVFVALGYAVFAGLQGLAQPGVHADRRACCRGRWRHGDQTRHLRFLRQDAGRVGRLLALGVRPARDSHRRKPTRA